MNSLVIAWMNNICFISANLAIIEQETTMLSSKIISYKLIKKDKKLVINIGE